METAERPIRFSASPDDLAAAGKSIRSRVLRAAQCEWKPLPSRRDPVEILRESDAQRLPNLVPIRYGRMLRSPFAFFRGAAAVMAADLAQTPNTGIVVQCCGDCHLQNFGAFASPERTIVFDINDFDETLPAPWEWDAKRLAASCVLAARDNGFSDDSGREAVLACAAAYRKTMRGYLTANPLDVWYHKFEADELIDAIEDPRRRATLKQRLKKAMRMPGSDAAYPKLAQVVAGEVHIRDNPPLIYHPEETRSAGFVDVAQAVLQSYRETLPDDRRLLLDRYRFVDAAIKVVGVGSVGTRCWIALMMSATNDPLFLQLKQANASVLEPYAGKSRYEHHGRRVVMGQRLMQAASDIFLGWTTGPEAQFYVRQLRDAKISPLIESFDEAMLTAFAAACGRNLARAHAKSGNACTIGGYLGKSDEFDEALASFAVAYADQTVKDHERLKEAVRSGAIQASAG